MIYIESKHRTEPIMIYKNTFTNNAAYFGAVAIFIRARTESQSFVSSIDPASETDLQCGGYFIAENYFERN